MSEVIYRKYRPQKFKDLIGQEHVRRTIENEVATDKIAHAYLFTGPRGIGKTTAARLLAKAVNCLERQPGESEPCGKCTNCRQLIDGRFLDLIEIDAASNRGINEIRELRERVRYSPSSAKFKVFIIDEVHMLTTEAFNALLKTLEEPPAYAIFILATTEPHKIPETIISRCQRFDFKKVGLKELVKRLEMITKKEAVEIDQAVLVNIAIRGEGCLRDAESLLQQILSLGEKRVTMDEASLILPRSDLGLVIVFVRHLFLKNAALGLELVNRLLEEGIDLEQFTGDLLEFLRKVLIYKVDSRYPLDLDDESLSQVAELSQKIGLAELTGLIEMTIAKKKDLKQTDILQLPLELLVVEFFGAGPQPTPAVAKDGLAAKVSDNRSQEMPETKKDERPASSSNLKSEHSAAEPVGRFDNSQPSTLTLEAIKEQWPAILAEIKKCNHSVLASLKTGHLLAFNVGVLEIGFPYKFHRERAADFKNRKVVEDCLLKIFGEKIQIEIKTVNFSPQIETDSQDETIKNVLEVFGGEVVEE